MRIRYLKARLLDILVCLSETSSRYFTRCISGLIWNSVSNLGLHISKKTSLSREDPTKSDKDGSWTERHWLWRQSGNSWVKFVTEKKISRWSDTGIQNTDWQAEYRQELVLYTFSKQPPERTVWNYLSYGQLDKCARTFSVSGWLMYANNCQAILLRQLKNQHV